MYDRDSASASVNGVPLSFASFPASQASVKQSISGMLFVERTLR